MNSLGRKLVTRETHKHEVLDGNNPDPAQYDKLGGGVIKDIPGKLPPGSPIDVTFGLTDESLIHLTPIGTNNGTSVIFEAEARCRAVACSSKARGAGTGMKTVA